MARGDNGEERKMAGEIFFEGKMARGKWLREKGLGENGRGESG
jgi:hypothetical protein